MDSLLYKPMASLQLVVDEFSLSKWAPMDKWMACLVANDYTQIFGLDYGGTFSPIAKMILGCLLLPMVVMNHFHYIN